MHLQMRAKPISSPPDVEKLLSLLTGINLSAVGGSDVEFGGELVIVPEDGQEDAVAEILTAAGYPFRVFDKDDDTGLDLCEVTNEPGALHACLQAVAQHNLEKGRIIRDITVGVPDEEDRANGVIPVQIFSEQVRTPASLGMPDPVS